MCWLSQNALFRPALVALLRCAVATRPGRLEKRAQELKEGFGLLKPDNVTHATASVDEFPRMREDSGLT
jgi:hypothetical protein